MTNSIKKINAQEVDPTLILTPRINEWMLKQKENLYTEEALARVWQEMIKPGRNRSASFSASSAGVCLRRQELAFLGKPEKPHLPKQIEVFQAGHWYHRRWQAMLLSANLIEEIEVPLFWPKYLSKGSADGRGFIWWETTNPNYHNREFILEIKSVGAHMWQKYLDLGRPSDEHLKQMHRYMLVSGIHLAIYIMIDKGNQGSDGWVEYVVEADPKLLEESKQELEELKRAAETKTLHPIKPYCRIRQGKEYNYCPFNGKDGPCFQTKEWG
jgi:hypothetical protein